MLFRYSRAERTTLTIILCVPFVDTALVVERRWRQVAKENAVMHQLSTGNKCSHKGTFNYLLYYSLNYLRQKVDMIKH